MLPEHASVGIDTYTLALRNQQLVALRHRACLLVEEGEGRGVTCWTGPSSQRLSCGQFLKGNKAEDGKIIRITFVVWSQF